MPHLLPQFTSEDEYDRAAHPEQIYRPAIEEIGRRHALPQPALLRKYPTGSLVVFAYGETYAIKLYPPLQNHHFRDETAFYRYLDGKSKLPAPAVVATGQLEGWDYLVMTQLKDPLLDDVWPQISAENRRALLFQLGRHMAELHALPAAPLAHTCPDWSDFLRQQAAGASARQQAAGTPDHWLEQITPYLQKWLPQLPTTFKPALLHTELCGNCLTVAYDQGRWHLTGFLDCADSFVGHGEYDFASVLLLICKSDRALRSSFFAGYGLKEQDLGDELAQRIMTYTLLHRYSNLQWYMAMQPPQKQTKTLEHLSAQWYSC